MALAAPNRGEAAPNSKSIYPASLISQRITMMAGIYNPETKKHELSTIIPIDDIGSWRKFADNIKDIPPLKENVEVESFTEQNFILIKELDKDGFVTGETIFSPGLIQQKVIELSFKLRTKESRSFFLDLLGMQMKLASYESPVNQDIKYTDPGIVIRFPISNILSAPIWRVRDTDEMITLADNFDVSGPNYYDITYVYKASIDTIDSYLEGEQGIFQVYLNLDDPSMPYKVCIDTQGIFAISRSSYTRMMPDTHDYYRFFSDYFAQLSEAKIAEPTKTEKPTEATEPPKAEEITP
jgi:hypothetical protein